MSSTHQQAIKIYLIKGCIVSFLCFWSLLVFALNNTNQNTNTIYESWGIEDIKGLANNGLDLPQDFFYSNSIFQIQKDSLDSAINDSINSQIDSIATKVETNITDVADTDSLLVLQTDSLDTLKSDINPEKSLLYSAIYPGGGQFYNKQVWKTPIFAGLFTSSLIWSLRNRSKYTDYRDAYQLRLVDPDDLSQYPNLSKADLLSARVDAKRAYNLSFAATCVTYGFNLMDAYTSGLLLKKNRPHSPVKAAYYSAMLPGMGQVYNRKYWKVPIVYGGFATGAWFIYSTNRRLKGFTQAYIYRDDENFVPEPFVLSATNNITSPDLYLSWRDRYRKWFELSIIITTAWYVINILDATVDGHLYEFDEQMKDIDDSMSFKPNQKSKLKSTLKSAKVSPFIQPISKQQNAFGFSMSLTF